MHLDLRILASVFGVIFVAELPDKTALAAVVLATRNKPLPTFLGSALALTVQSLVAVAAGRLLALLPARPVHVGAGILFVVSAFFMWRRASKEDDKGKDEKDDKGQRAGFWRSFATVFGVVFIAEWGDLTQLGTAALAARYGDPLSVFLGATAALWCVAGIAVFIGHRAGKLLNPALTARIAAVLFVGIGVALIAGWL